MATIKRRINITLPDAEDRAIVALAKRDKVPTATKARELLSVALELEEDIVLGEIALSRDKRNARYISHKKVWENLM